MMKWGRKKSSSSSSSVSHVFPLLWLSMFKRMTDSTEPNSANAKPKEKRNSLFREERNEGPKSGDVLQSVWYDSDDELEVHFPSHHRLMPRAVKLEGEEKSQMLGNVIARRRKMRESPRHVEILQKGENESEKSKMLRRRALKDIKSRKTYQRIPKEKSTELPRGVDEAEENSTKSIARDLFELEPVRIIQTEKDFQKSAVFDLRKQRNSSFANSSLRKIQEDRKFETLKREQVSALSEEDFFISEWKNLKDMKINEIMMKSEEQRKSALISWESSRKRKNQSRKGVYTPRTTARIECKIRALEDLKKAKMRTKKATKEKAAKDASHGTIAFDSFAVVKNSWDPQEDFKTSMAEMITANGIRQPQELEELLACYLTLNCDEYHDLIIKVFRQVWFDLNRSIFDPTIKCEHCCTCNAKTLA